MSGTPDRPVSARLEELRRLREAGTGRPWTLASMLRPDYFSEGWTFLTERGRVGHLVGGNEADAALIVAAVNAFAALLDIAEAAVDVQDEWDRLGPTGTHSTLVSHGVFRAALDRLNTEDGA